MLTEYSSYDDIRKFIKKAIEKKDEMYYNGWLGKEVYKHILKWKDEKDIKSRTTFYNAYFTLENQRVNMEFCPYLNEYGRVDKKNVSTRMTTFIETNSGKICISFNGEKITMLTPHFQKRSKERVGLDRWCSDFDEHKIPYKRNNRNYELHIYGNYVLITKKDKHGILWYITIIHRDKCTDQNYANLFKRAGKAIDEQDIYEWK